jgi:hypothetical protein
VYIPWLWQATVGQSAPGPAAVAFWTDKTIYFESTGVVVGRGGDYRIQPMSVGEEAGPVSPDGRYYVRQGPPRLVDLDTGAQRRLPGSAVLAWSPDGRQVLTVQYREDGVIEYGPDGKQLNDPRRADGVSVVDVATGSVHELASEHMDLYARGAFAPDARRIVVGTGDSPNPQTLKVIDAAGGGVRWSVPLGQNRMLAGSGAWSPDGRRIALFAFTGCAALDCDASAVEARRWRLEFLDAETGAELPGSAIPLAARPSRMLGWRYGIDPVVVLHEQHTKLVAVRPDGGPELLLDLPASVTDVDVPADLVKDGRFGGASSRPDPLAARWEVYPVPVLLVAFTALFLVRRRNRRRS